MKQLKCKICGQEFKNTNSLLNHLHGKIHNISSREYYDTYLKSENEGLCLYCQKPTRYVNMNKGYKTYCSSKCSARHQASPAKPKLKIDTSNFSEDELKHRVCKVCQEVCKNISSLIRHVFEAHDLTSKEYYDKYVKQEDEGNCKQCGKPTNYTTFKEGYNTFCSNSCSVKNRAKPKEIIKIDTSNFSEEELKNRVCKICGNVYNNPVGLLLHAHHSHNLKSREYYNLYYKKENEELCDNCGKPVSYVSFTVGYQRFCSSKCAARSQKTIAKVKQTKLERYGDPNYNNMEQNKQTCLERYGAETFLGSQIGQERCKEALIEKYGVDNVFRLDSIKEKTKESNLERYGAEHPLQKEEFLLKRQKTNLEKYGVKELGQSHELMRKAYETKRKKGNAPKTELYFEDLCSKHNIDFKIQGETNDPRYPYMYDFYIPEKDLFIELHIHPTHGNRWYDPERDEQVVKDLQEKDNWFYKRMVNVWTCEDVEKRKTARENNLNYVVLWSKKDIDKWFELCCPIGKDWEHEYTWLPK